MALILVAAAVIFALDRLTKAWVLNSLAPLESIPVIPGVLHFTHVQNPGAAFGLLPNQTAFFVIVTSAVIIVALLYGRHAVSPWVRLGFGLLVGGAAGNLLDRLQSGAVTDFIDFKIWGPVFNAADSAIVVGMFIVGWHLMREMPEEPAASESLEAPEEGDSAPAAGGGAGRDT